MSDLKRKVVKLSPAKELPQLFDIAEDLHPEPEIRPIRNPIWTENKAKLIERYLFYFVLITKHGTYIDGFAGPQEEGKPDMWAARLVLESEPKWFRNFYFFDKGSKQIASLEQLRESQPPKPKRKIEVIKGDFNRKIIELLKTTPFREKEACFCLLDQRTFECQWKSVKNLAECKSQGNKIELFYFLCNGWFGRALHGIKQKDVLKKWWGRKDWEILYQISSDERRDLIVERFKSELGYHSVKAWPIYERNNGGATMYYMIHATDHPEAPSLMRRAYSKAVSPKEPIEQLRLALGLDC